VIALLNPASSVLLPSRPLSRRLTTINQPWTSSPCHSSIPFLYQSRHTTQPLHSRRISTTERIHLESQALKLSWIHRIGPWPWSAACHDVDHYDFVHSSAGLHCISPSSRFRDISRPPLITNCSPVHARLTTCAQLFPSVQYYCWKHSVRETTHSHKDSDNTRLRTAPAFYSYTALNAIAIDRHTVRPKKLTRQAQSPRAPPPV